MNILTPKERTYIVLFIIVVFLILISFQIVSFSSLTSFGGEFRVVPSKYRSPPNLETGFVGEKPIHKAFENAKNLNSPEAQLFEAALRESGGVQ